eukprot:732351-Rhodomonas_salina.3
MAGQHEVRNQRREAAFPVQAQCSAYAYPGTAASTAMRVKVTIVSQTPGATVFYTTDGTDPEPEVGSYALAMRCPVLTYAFPTRCPVLTGGYASTRLVQRVVIRSQY